jgi:hypothetical protein
VVTPSFSANRINKEMSRTCTFWEACDVVDKKKSAFWKMLDRMHEKLKDDKNEDNAHWKCRSTQARRRLLL